MLHSTRVSLYTFMSVLRFDVQIPLTSIINTNTNKNRRGDSGASGRVHALLVAPIVLLLLPTSSRGVAIYDVNSSLLIVCISHKQTKINKVYFITKEEKILSNTFMNIEIKSSFWISNVICGGLLYV